LNENHTDERTLSSIRDTQQMLTTSDKGLKEQPTD